MRTFCLLVIFPSSVAEKDSCLKQHERVIKRKRKGAKKDQHCSKYRSEKWCAGTVTGICKRRYNKRSEKKKFGGEDATRGLNTKVCKIKEDTTRGLNTKVCKRRYNKRSEYKGLQEKIQQEVGIQRFAKEDTTRGLNTKVGKRRYNKRSEYKGLQKKRQQEV